MNTIEELNKRKVPIVRIDGALDSYNDIVLFPEKLAKANEMLRTIGLPNDKNVKKEVQTKVEEKYSSIKKFSVGKFSTKMGKDGQHYFNLLATNGQVILTSEGYTTTSAMNNGIESVKKNAAEDKYFDRERSNNGKFYFNLKATNGQVIGKSQMYESEATRDNCIESVKKSALGAVIIEE